MKNVFAALAHACYDHQEELEKTAMAAFQSATMEFLIELQLRRKILAGFGAVFS